MRRHRLPYCIEPLRVGNGLLSPRRDWLLGRLLLTRLGLANRFYRQRFRPLSLCFGDDRCGRSGRLLVRRQQRFERLGGIWIHSTTGLFERLDVAAYQSTASARIDILVEHRNDSSAQALARRLG